MVAMDDPVELMNVMGCGLIGGCGLVIGRGVSSLLEGLLVIIVFLFVVENISIFHFESVCVSIVLVWCFVINTIFLSSGGLVRTV